MPTKSTTEKKETSAPDTAELLKQIEELKAELKAVKKSVKAEQAQEKDVPNADEKFNPNKMVRIINMYNGFANSLRIDDHGGFRTMYKFGESMRIRLSEAENIVRLNRGFAEKGYFLFDDPEVADYLGLGEVTAKAVNVNFINSLSDCPPDVLASVYESANKYFKDLIMDTFVTGYVRGEKIGFRDQNRLEALSKASGEDVSIRIKALQETRA